MDKQKIAQVLTDAATTLVKVAQERDLYQGRCEVAEAQVQALKNRMEAEKLAMDLVEKGFHNDQDVGALADDLEKLRTADPQDFAVKQAAVAMAGPDMFRGTLVGSVNSSTSGVTDFERYIYGDVR